MEEGVGILMEKRAVNGIKWFSARYGHWNNWKLVVTRFGGHQGRNGNIWRISESLATDGDEKGSLDQIVSGPNI